MGEVFNGSIGYVADYQNHVEGLFNYPMFFTLHNVYGDGASMYNIRVTYNSEQAAFKDVDALGSFMNNHDNSRWLANWPGKISGFKSAVTFTTETSSTSAEEMTLLTVSPCGTP
jgi:alpha-amylase